MKLFNSRPLTDGENDGSAAVRRTRTVRAAEPAVSVEPVSIGAAEGMSEPPIMSESDGTRSGFAPDRSFQPVPLETFEETPGILNAEEPDEMPFVTAAEAPDEDFSVPVADEASMVPKAAEPETMPSVPAAEKPDAAPSVPYSDDRARESLRP
ncbi:hypothetical protein JW777_06680, partial [bacterium]|nr:hypothetical protein [bacterium]